MSRKLHYENWVNFNWDITPLKKPIWHKTQGAWGIIKHIEDNTKRKTGQDRLNKTPELKNIYEGPKVEEIIKEYEAVKDKLPKGGRGAQPFRFITASLNAIPNKENAPFIIDWYKNIKAMYEDIYGKDNIVVCALHNNETRPGIHIALKNWNTKLKKWGVYKNGIKIPMSGEKGQEVVNQVWDRGGKIVKALAGKYGREYRQEDTTDLNKTIQQVRKQEPRVEYKEGPSKTIQKAIFEPVKSNVLLLKGKSYNIRYQATYYPETGLTKVVENYSVLGSLGKQWEEQWHPANISTLNQEDRKIFSQWKTNFANQVMVGITKWKEQNPKVQTITQAEIKQQEKKKLETGGDKNPYSKYEHRLN